MGKSRMILRLFLCLTVLSFAAEGFVVPAGAASFRAACVKVNITPDKPQWLLGYPARQSEGVHDPLYHRIVALDDGQTQFFLVSSDLCFISPGYYDAFCRQLEKETGIKAAQVWWTVTHTHSAPEVGPPGLGAVFLPDRYSHPPNPEYSEWASKALIDGIKQARSKLEHARLVVGTGMSMANINRRARDADGRVLLGMNPEGPVDRQMGLIRLERLDGSPLALIVNYAMHATVLGMQNRQISADAPGIVAEYVERKLGAPMLFINGAAGDIAPIYSVYPDFKSSHITEFNVLLGDRILAANRSMSPATAEVTLWTGEQVIETPRKAGMKWAEDLGDYLRETSEGTTMVRIPVRFLKINNSLAIWAAPLELFNEIAVKVRNQSPYPHTFFFGYCNGWLGYLPTKQAFAEGGYEPRVSPFTEQAEEDFTRAVITYLRSQQSQPKAQSEGALFRTVELDVGESQQVELSDGKTAKVKLLGFEETRDELRSAIRRAQVKVEVNGQTITLTSATYHLPVTVAGVQIDCPVTRGHIEDSNRGNIWGLAKDVRLRLWPAGSPWLPAGTFVYPVRQRWFATNTQMANELSFVDGEERPGRRRFYYHYGLDIGGSEGKVEVVSAADGLVVSAGVDTLPGHGDAPIAARYDVVYVLDAQGWYYRYSHLKTIDAVIRPGQTVKMGQTIGVLGKEGSSGGWSHLHFDIHSRQPSGSWGIQEGYAFLWEAYQRQYAPKLRAVARPHQLIWSGRKALLDGSRSDGKGLRYQWTFTDGTTASGARVERLYKQPGSYSEILKITDAAGNIDYDFAVVQVIDRQTPEQLPPTISANYAPTFDLKPGDPVTFKVRTFRTTDGEETWDFGDGSPPVTVKSDGNVNPMAPDGYAETVHRYKKAGHFVVRVERSNKVKAVAHLHVVVGDHHGLPRQ